MKRRNFLKAVGGGIAALVLNPNTGSAEPFRKTGDGRSCRIVVFGADGLRIDFAQTLRSEGAPALSALNPPICSLNGGLSMTQPGWVSIWTGMPSFLTGTYSNEQYAAILPGGHIMDRLMDEFSGKDFFCVWIAAKGPNLRGDVPSSPHYRVKNKIEKLGYPGVYHSDSFYTDEHVHQWAAASLAQALSHENFCCFIHFGNPDNSGHKFKDYTMYMQYARQVDEYVFDLMQQLPGDTDIIYCSDHGFDFISLGDIQDNHAFSPRGVLATNFPTVEPPFVCQHSIGRLIYMLSGGNPRSLRAGGHPYGMYGVDLV